MNIKVIPERDLIFLAGVIDGEGSIYIRRQEGRKSPIHTLDVEVSMTDYHAVKRFYDVFGIGSFRPVRRKKKEPHHRQAWKWVATSNDALLVLELVQPYLMVKKEQAHLAIAFSKSKGKRTGRGGLSKEVIEEREGYYQKMKELKMVEYRIEDYWNPSSLRIASSK